MTYDTGNKRIVLIFRADTSFSVYAGCRLRLQVSGRIQRGSNSDLANYCCPCQTSVSNVGIISTCLVSVHPVLIFVFQGAGFLPLP